MVEPAIIARRSAPQRRRAAFKLALGALAFAAAAYVASASGAPDGLHALGWLMLGGAAALVAMGVVSCANAWQDRRGAVALRIGDFGVFDARSTAAPVPFDAIAGVRVERRGGRTRVTLRVRGLEAYAKPSLWLTQIAQAKPGRVGRLALDLRGLDVPPARIVAALAARGLEIERPAPPEPLARRIRRWAARVRPRRSPAAAPR